MHARAQTNHGTTHSTRAHVDVSREQIAQGLKTSRVLQAMDAATQQMDILGGWEFRERAEAMLKQVGIPSSGHLVGKMSGGQKRRVALAAALLASPDLIIADEPTNHMDHQVMSRSVAHATLPAGDRH